MSTRKTAPGGSRGREEKAGQALPQSTVDLPNDQTPTPVLAMSKSDRADLAGLARKRAKVSKAMVAQRMLLLLADVKDQLAAMYKFDDEQWANVNQRAAAAVAVADQQIAETCRQLGIPEEFRPSLSLGWSSRGENAAAGRRAEMLGVARARIDAAGATANVTIDHQLLMVETELVREGLDSHKSLAFLEAMPTAEELLPRLCLDELEPGKEPTRDRWGHWEPPAGVAAALLTPSSATSREQKRRAMERALHADPTGSDRAIAAAAGVDHKTVAAHRVVAGEFPSPGGEFPSEADPDGGNVA